MLVGWLLRRLTPHTVFMHVGAGDCELAREAASYVERVYAVDPERAPERTPLNLRVVSDGGLPVPEGTVDVALTGDAAKLRYIHRCLAPGGVLVATDPGLREALRAAGFSRVRRPWFAPILEAIK